MGKSYYYVEVETLQGESLIFQLPNDLQGAMRAYRHENPETWEALLKEALINMIILLKLEWGYCLIFGVGSGAHIKIISISVIVGLFC